MSVLGLIFVLWLLWMLLILLMTGVMTLWDALVPPPPPRPRRTPRVFVWVHEPPRWSDALVIVGLMVAMALIALVSR